MGKIATHDHLLKDGRKITVRHGRGEDAEALLEYLEEILNDGDGMITDLSEMDYSVNKEIKWIQGFLDHPDQILLIAECDGVIVGNLDFHIGIRKRMAHHGWFGMAVRPGYRGQGIGSILLNTLIQWVQTRDHIEKISLAVLASNTAAINLYKKFDFVQEGYRSREFKLSDGTYLDDIMMCRFKNP